MTASREDTEKMLNHDGVGVACGIGGGVGAPAAVTATATLGRHGQMVVVGPPTVSIATAANATYIPNAQWKYPNDLARHV